VLYISLFLAAVIVGLLWPEKKKKVVGADPRVCPDKNGTTNKGAHVGAPLHKNKTNQKGGKGR